MATPNWHLLRELFTSQTGTPHLTSQPTSFREGFSDNRLLANIFLDAHPFSGDSGIVTLTQGISSSVEEIRKKTVLDTSIFRTLERLKLELLPVYTNHCTLHPSCSYIKISSSVVRTWNKKGWEHVDSPLCGVNQQCNPKSIWIRMV